MEKDTRLQDEIYKELKVSFTSVEQQIKAQKEEKKLFIEKNISSRKKHQENPRKTVETPQTHVV